MDKIPEGLITAEELARRLPAGSTRSKRKRLHKSTVIRWILKGKLPALRIGHNYLIREEDAAACLQKVVPRYQATERLRTPRQQQRAYERAKATLEKMRREWKEPED